MIVCVSFDILFQNDSLLLFIYVILLFIIIIMIMTSKKKKLVKYVYTHKIAYLKILTGYMLLFIVHVKLTGGKDGPETQVAFNNSPTEMPFLLLFGVLYTLSTGLWAGNSATSIFDSATTV